MRPRPVDEGGSNFEWQQHNEMSRRECGEIELMLQQSRRANLSFSATKKDTPKGVSFFVAIKRTLAQRRGCRARPRPVDEEGRVQAVPQHNEHERP